MAGRYVKGKVLNCDKRYLQNVICDLNGLSTTNREGRAMFKKKVADIVTEVEHRNPFKLADTLYEIAWKRCLKELVAK